MQALLSVAPHADLQNVACCLVPTPTLAPSASTSPARMFSVAVDPLHGDTLNSPSSRAENSLEKSQFELAARLHEHMRQLQAKMQLAS